MFVLGWSAKLLRIYCYVQHTISVARNVGIADVLWWGGYFF